jgi:hypothetical protein
MVPPREPAIAMTVGAYNIALCDFFEDSGMFEATASLGH